MQLYGLLIILFSYLFFPLQMEKNTDDDYFDPSFTRYDDYTYDKNIKSVLLYNAANEMSYPFLALNSGQRLKLSFDELSYDFKTYSYDIIHCNANWQPSQLLKNEYLQNFQEVYLENYNLSTNTDVKYTNYSLLFPNENVKFLVSGNYVLTVYEEGNKEKPVLTKRFIVYENKVSVNTNVKEATNVLDKYYKQEIDFTINHEGYSITDAFKNINVVILQNYRWDNAITGLKPRFIRDNVLDYDYNKENTFYGINEFRNFDVKSTLYQTLRVERIQYNNIEGLDYVYLLEDESRSYKQYTNQDDLNGNFLIKKNNAENSSYEADYVRVHFKLPYSPPLNDGKLYLFGKFTDWKFKEDFKLNYDTIGQAYFTDVLLKQGYYDYMYCFVEDGKKNVGDLSIIEGTHQQTINDYIILVYHKHPFENFDRIIGLKIFNSIRE